MGSLRGGSASSGAASTGDVEDGLVVGDGGSEKKPPVNPSPPGLLLVDTHYHGRVRLKEGCTAVDQFGTASFSQ